MRAQAIAALVDGEQRAAVLAPAGPLLIVAGAATGKTCTLTVRLAYRVASGEIPAGAILAVTHSTKAARAACSTPSRHANCTQTAFGRC